ncbi:MAG: phosphatase PAP2 family protein [Muribaculaceae bacterium]|nr:phosphatase PAP2 family protein [Muribaculaceae bacterium]
MPIDTSTYYPEVEGPLGEKSKESLNGIHDSLFGNKKNEKEDNCDKPDMTPQPSAPGNAEDENIWEKAAETFSHIISWVLVPLLMPVFGILFIFRLSILDVIPAGMQTAVTFVIAGINFFAPMLLIFLLKLFGIVQDVGLNSQKERAIPYIITAICYGCSAWFVAARGAPAWVAMFFCGGALASLINLGINFKWKISAHAAAIAGLVALLIRLQRDVAAEPQLFVWLLITVGAAGLLGSARVWLGRHTVWQVLAGYAVGFCSVFFMMYIR